MLRTIALVALAASCASARRYSDDEYRRLGGILYAAAASSAASTRRAAVNANGDATSAGTGDHVARWAGHVTSTLDGVMEARLAALLEDTYTEECREKVANAFIDTYKRALSEDYLPFEQTGYTSDCDKKAPASGAAPLPADEIRLCYLLIVHESPEQIARRSISEAGAAGAWMSAPGGEEAGEEAPPAAAPAAAASSLMAIADDAARRVRLSHPLAA